MKRILLAVAAIGTLMLTSCETTREVTINADGSGQYSSTSDFSALIGLAKMADQDGKMEKMEDKSMDTTVSLKELTDSLPSLTPEERKLASKGSFSMNMNLGDEKMMANVKIPFGKLDELGKMDLLASRILEQGMQKIMSEGKGGGGMDDMKLPEGGGMEAYYTTTYSAGKIEKRLLAEKYARVGDDENMAALKEISGQGMPMQSKLVINLPRPATKVTGKNAVLSDDKKKVTITESTEDFFDDGKSLEFTIEF